MFSNFFHASISESIVPCRQQLFLLVNSSGLEKSYLKKSVIVYQALSSVFVKELEVHYIYAVTAFKYLYTVTV